MAPNTPAADAKKRKWDDLDRRLTSLETTSTDHEHRLDTVEYRLEMETSYRFLRCENSQSLKTLFDQVEQGEVQKQEIRVRAGQAVTREVREIMEREVDETYYKQQSDDLSGGRRVWPTAAARKGVLDSFSLAELVEWVTKHQSGVYSIRLKPGEPSRQMSEAVKQTINWTLYTYGKLAGPEQSKMQLYPDKGPKQRAKGKGKQKGKGGKGKGKGRHNTGAKGGAREDAA